MFSIRKLFGKEEKFFDLLEASAEEAKISSGLLARFLQARAQAGELKSVDDFVHSRRKDKRITQQITEELCRTFVTPLEREDIESLAHGLSRIPKAAAKLAERLVMAGPHLDGIDFSKHADMMAKATDAVQGMIRQLRDMKDLEKIKTFNDRLQLVELEADRYMMELLRDLFGGKYEPYRSMVLKDIYELMEKVIDRCHDVGNTVMHIVLKNS